VLTENSNFVELQVGEGVIGFSAGSPLIDPRDGDSPHYALQVNPNDMVPLKERLESFGVPTETIWTRSGVTAHMYFYDPSGNLFELYCRSGFKGAEDLEHAPHAGGTYRFDPTHLRYDWKG
jgi:hypothetical protein